MHVEHLLFRLLNQSAASAAIALLRCLTKRPKTHSVAPPLRILIRCATNDTLNPNTQVAPPLRILIRADRARNCFTDPAAYDTILEALPDCPRGTLLPIHQYDIDGDGGNPNGGLLSSGGGSGAFAAMGTRPRRRRLATVAAVALQPTGSQPWCRRLAAAAAAASQPTGTTRQWRSPAAGAAAAAAASLSSATAGRHGRQSSRRCVAARHCSLGVMLGGRHSRSCGAAGRCHRSCRKTRAGGSDPLLAAHVGRRLACLTAQLAC